MEQRSTQIRDKQEEEINLRQLFEQYLYYWKWFVLSLILALAGAIVYLRYAQKSYSTTAKILLKDEKSAAAGELAGIAELTSSMGFGGTRTAFVTDQIEVLSSRRLMRKVVDKHHLNVIYSSKGSIRTSEVLEDDMPFVVQPQGNQDSIRINMRIVLKKGTNLDITDLYSGDRIETTFDKVVRLGKSSVVFRRGNNKNSSATEYIINVIPKDWAVDLNLAAINIKPNKELQSYIVNFSMMSTLERKAALVLNSLIEVYNADLTNDKLRMTRATSDFINKRLMIISKDLSGADEEAAEFKSANSMVDMATEAGVFLSTASDNDKKVLEYRTQLQLVDHMNDYLKNQEVGKLLPSNIGLQDASIGSSIEAYNKLVLERDDLLKSASEQNPTVIAMNENIAESDKNIRQSLINYQRVTKLALNSIERKSNEIKGRISSIPSQEQGFKKISRQQKIVESLYLLLLQKREESEVKAAATPDNLKIIDAAYGNGTPVSPKRPIVILGAILLGFLIPFIALYLKFLLDNKIHSRKDIEEIVKIPVLGEIPTAEDTIVHLNDRSSLAEAFRILRTNMNFMFGADKKEASKVIFVTSTISGEGKSFVTTNLAQILSMSGKKVLLIGADIRSPKVLDYLGLSHLQHTNVGITQFLINPDMDVDNIIIKKPGNYDFDVVYSGYIAPNPAELLMNGHFDDVIKYAREHYDYILVDTAPVSLVTDTLLIAHNADLTLYVSRVNYLDKRLLQVPRELYFDGKLNNLAAVVNDVDFARGYGYGYGYGDKGKKKTGLAKVWQDIKDRLNIK
ncbi:tyrosine protein kinase [Sphingobacterium sp. Ag1]|uniref:GumC family protein n=1 Tax=Sphingobacterium sp. Ag1 TaxID=1643451 RepID=UPI0006277349|nr:polysaccharide biosynthesis tyrosine autokinase [Sphingobacterium sp. Ag1]KKO91177.1 tyrosine protein kinase [Sphingobacterium sp. Ag1]